ncbi:PREDICTED: uncharacterized protein LOC109332537 [Lupinus angustifolius]|uniref:uncharacterized protein LOC109332537 n=1 Tax=Lupinus angustifolius TaxID=3871 RepID=UPI00092FD0E7|nr:PREDICTED: uncharacterized protein LOC109332537 [Lupinus angustifolius]
MVEDFYRFGNFPRGCNASFIVIIPKNNCPHGLNEYKPISLIGCIQKIVSKLLATRLKKVIHLVISECQSAFIKGRFIIDGVVVTNEVIDQARKKKRGDCFILKADFEKAYDSVNWDFLLYMMERLSFCLKWRVWNKNLLHSNSVSILVNVSPTKEFTMAHGLRQGDPISSFLFLIVAEGLSGIMRATVLKNIYTGHKVGKDEVSISHLQYTDDILLIGENSEHNSMMLKSILKCFELASGLKINFHKSCFMGLNSSRDFVTKAVDKLYCAIGSVPFKFLRIHVGTNPKRLSTWFPIIDSFKKKLSLWKHKLISFGGRVALEKEAIVESLGAWSNEVWSWIIHWRRNLFVWEEEEYEGLLQFLHNSMPKQHTADSWTWIHDISGQYSVKSAYQSLHHVEGSQDLVFFKRLWASNVSLKMKCLVWRIALDGVPTKVNLVHRGGLSMQDPLIFSLCGELEETTSHLFFSCSISYLVWQKLYSCFGLTSIIHNDLMSLFASHENMIWLEKKKK